MSEHRLFGVLVTYHRPEALAGRLGELERQTRTLDRLVIVNNAANDPVDDLVSSRPGAAHQVRVLTETENLGPAGGIATGMRYLLQDADDDDIVVLFDDDDPLPDDHVLLDLETLLRERIGSRDSLAGIALRGALLDDRTGRLHASAVSDRPVPVTYLMGNALPAYRISALRAAGVFRDDLFFGFDDLEYGLRLARTGYTVEAHDLGRRLHRPSRLPTWDYRRAPWRTYYTTRNLLTILWEYGRRGAAVRFGVVLGLAKPAFNLLRHPGAHRDQARMGVLALIDAVRGRMGRTVEPTSTKIARPDL